MDDNFKQIASALNDRFKANCRSEGLDVTTAAERHVAERVVHYWHVGMGPAPVMLCGGLCFRQALRPTSDADLRVVRRYTESELRSGMAIIAELLNAEGITLRAVKPIRELDVGTGVPVTRIPIEAFVGNIRAHTQIDLALAVGPDALPDKRDIRKTTFQSMMPKGPSYTALAQPWETMAAERWLALLTQRDDDLRAKHAVDLILLSAQDLYIDKVASELERVCRHRGLDLSVLSRTPAALSWSDLAKREQAWVRECIARRLEMPIDQGFRELHAHWQAVSAAVELRRRKERLAAVVRERRAPQPDFEFGAAAIVGNNVIPFRPR